jgi:hypothetical protein
MQRVASTDMVQWVTKSGLEGNLLKCLANGEHTGLSDAQEAYGEDKYK